MKNCVAPRRDLRRCRQRRSLPSFYCVGHRPTGVPWIWFVERKTMPLVGPRPVRLWFGDGEGWT